MLLSDLFARVVFEAEGAPTGAPSPAQGAEPAAPPAAPVAPAQPTGTTLTEPAPQPTSGKPEATEGAEPKPEQPTAPEPVTYADFKLPEGLAADDATLTTFKDAASKLGVTQEHAQALIDAVAPKLRADAEAALQRWNDLNTQWQADVKKEFAGEAFEKMKTNVGRFFDDFIGAAGTAERKALNEALLLTGAGNNPHIVRLIAKAAEAYAEGTPVNGNPPGTARRNAADVLYDSHSKETQG